MQEKLMENIKKTEGNVTVSVREIPVSLWAKFKANCAVRRISIQARLVELIEAEVKEKVEKC